MEKTVSAECPEGFEPSVYYDFYSLVQDDAPQPRPEEEYETTLVALDMLCNTPSQNENQGTGFSLKDCAAITAELGYEFFNFNTDFGDCTPVDAGSEECDGPATEGFQRAPYAFYWNMPLDQSTDDQSTDDQSEDDQSLNLNLIGEDILCQAEKSQLGFFTESVDVCAQEAFSYGPFFLYDPNDGECISVMTESADCVEGLVPSEYYDFYEIIPDS